MLLNQPDADAEHASDFPPAPGVQQCRRRGIGRLDHDHSRRGLSRMRIRWKLTILLLVVSLTPLIALKIADARAIGRFTGRSVRQMSAAITRRVEHELLLHIRTASDRLESLRRQTTSIVRTQETLFTGVLGGAISPANGPVRTNRDFDEGLVRPLREQTRFPGEQGHRVSYDSPVVVPSPGVDRATAERLAAPITGLADILDAMTRDLRKSIRGQFVCLESGVHIAYPGKGGYPQDFDGRTRPWYTAAVEAGDTVWVGRYRDAPTGETVVTCARPMYGPGGELLGVTGVDLSIAIPTTVLELPPELALGSSSCVVMLDDAGGWSLQLWRSDEPMPEILVADDPEVQAQIIADIRSGRSGVAEVGFRGEPSFWAYSTMSRDRAVLMIVPKHRVESLVEGARQELRALAQESARSTAAATLIVAVLVVFVAYLVSKTFSRPIRRLADAAEAIGRGDLSARVRIRPRGDEIGKLARTFNAMVPALTDRMRLSESIALAEEIQRGLLPGGDPEIPGYTIHGRSIYCDETGGDYFDYLMPDCLGEGRFGLVVGDVTGHGVAAALGMTAVRSLILSHAARAGSPGELLTIVNETASRDADRGRFVTLSIVVFDGDTMHWANAGHDPGLLFRSATGVFEQLEGSGLPLGVSDTERYETASAPAPMPGDVLILGTDGIWETRDPAGAFYGKARLRELIRNHADRPPREIGDALQEDLASFRKDAPILDDVTFVILKVSG
ncbi:MAG TPA: HAMP domain-containing protein [Deltaproteobacteria bacterium]|nr:HAMP domain-containing protein [Deltaproteobacteria bacterium]